MTQKEVYEKLWRIADHILRENRPCQFETRDGVTTCLANRVARTGSWFEDGCCRPISASGDPLRNKCEKLGPTGCTVQALGCKIFLCDIARQNDKLTAAAIDMLHHAAWDAKVPLAFYKGYDEEMGLRPMPVFRENRR